MRERIIRIVAGSFILLSLYLGYNVNEYWFLFTAFVGVNLLQSGISRWCLLETILKKMGVGEPKTQENSQTKTYA